MRRREQDGFALLLVLVMAASVAIMLYREMPRLVFESQRVKEQELITRGEQYKRAIQLYVRKFKKYPASLDDLETGTEMRFLRRRYKDPMTGKDEWRLIHIDNAGFYTDSLIHKPKQAEKEKKSQNTFITEGAAFGSSGPAPGAEGEKNQGAAIHGASDRPAARANQFYGPSGARRPGVPGQAVPGQPPGAGGPPYPQNSAGTYPGYPPQPGGAYPLPGGQPQPYPQQGVPGLPGPYGQQRPYGAANSSYPAGQNPYATPGRQPANPSQPGYGQPGQAPYPQSIPGLPGPYGQNPYQNPRQPASNPNAPAGGVGGSATPMLGPSPYIPTARLGSTARQPRPGIPGYRSPSRPLAYAGAGSLPASAPKGPAAAGASANQALGIIQNILTRPRPGGLQGLGGAGAVAGGGIPGGIAGVATTYEAEGIMVYNEHTKYNEWEFIYDQREEASKAVGAAARGAGMGSNRNPLAQGQGKSNRGSSFGSGSRSGSGFGSSFGSGSRSGSGFGSGSSFGSGSGSFGGGPTPRAPTRRP